MKRWYVAQVRPGRLREACAHLARQDFHAWVPEWSHGEPLFPGYVLVELDLSDRAVRWQAVNGTLGVVRLLPMHLERPDPVPFNIMTSIHTMLQEERDRPEPLTTVETFFPKDCRLKVTIGPLAGLHGRFLRRRKGSVELAMTLLGGEVPVTLPVTHVGLAA